MTTQVSAGRRARAGVRLPARTLGLGLATTYLSLVVLLPLAAVAAKGSAGGLSGLWDAVRAPEAAAALRLTVGAAVVVTLVDAVMGTAVAWLLVRDRFPGKRLVDTLIDLPFALPTIVAGLVLLTLYGPGSPVGVDLAYRRAGVVAALLFVTLPFVVRTVQPVLMELDADVEDAAASLGASRWVTFRRVILPALQPAIVAGAALSFARALSEFGATVLISGNLPFKTEVASVFVYGRIESDDIGTAAAVSTVLLALALLVLVALGLVQRWTARRG
ncbi:MAG: sulfate/thiosulfate transport system permease protein [Frankiales bacterium]|nr:sulfate/thiosulfate transport system permease protein [Frankiales bacterium]MDX6275217.1 sulfate/thiosulfate transport system permease protein [Frankiales bacterium]